MRFHKYFFDDTDLASLPGRLVHPRQTLVLPGVDELLTRLVCAAPGTMTLKHLTPDEYNLAHGLIVTGVLRQEGSSLFFDCPVFAERDLPALRRLTAAHAERLAQMLAARKDELAAAIRMQQDDFSAERHLYHLLCGGVLDGAVFDCLEADGLVSVGKALPSGEDCLTILYEDCLALNAYSDGLLCSFNRLRTNAGTFASFGDSRGSRRDLYRWFASRSVTSAAFPVMPPEALLTDATLPELREEAGRQFIRLLDGGDVPPVWQEVFDFFGYTADGWAAVPVYGRETLDMALPVLADVVLDAVYPGIIQMLNEAATCAELTAAAHRVSAQDIANEAYHLLFGQMNEALVRLHVVAAPPDIPGQGRFLRCFERQ